MSHTVKCINVSSETKKQLEALKVDLDNATNREALVALLEVYEEDPHRVLDDRPRDGF